MSNLNATQEFIKRNTRFFFESNGEGIAQQTFDGACAPQPLSASKAASEAKSVASLQKKGLPIDVYAAAVREVKRHLGRLNTDYQRLALKALCDHQKQLKREVSELRQLHQASGFTTPPPPRGSQVLPFANRQRELGDGRAPPITKTCADAEALITWAKFLDNWLVENRLLSQAILTWTRKLAPRGNDAQKQRKEDSKVAKLLGKRPDAIETERRYYVGLVKKNIVEGFEPVRNRGYVHDLRAVLRAQGRPEAELPKRYSAFKNLYVTGVDASSLSRPDDIGELDYLCQLAWREHIRQWLEAHEKPKAPPALPPSRPSGQQSPSSTPPAYGDHHQDPLLMTTPSAPLRHLG